MLPVGAALKQIKLAIAAYFLHMIQYHRHSTGIRIISRVIATFLEICRDVLHHTPVLLDGLEHAAHGPHAVPVRELQRVEDGLEAHAEEGEGGEEGEDEDVDGFYVGREGADRAHV